MSTDEQAPERPRADGGADQGADEAAHEGAHEGADEGARPSWWHRDHPTFSALAGFFTGLFFVALVPAAYVGVLSLFVGTDRVEDLFPFVLLTLVVPLALVASPRTRRFGKYFLLGIVLTAVVVVGVAALVLWYMVEHQG
jgi:hypothetical protein